MRKKLIFAIALTGLISCISLLQLSSCGSGSKKNTDKTDSIGPYADTNADTSPGVTELNAKDGEEEIQLSENDKHLATGTWIQTKDGKVIATLVVKYATGTIDFTLIKNGNTKATIKGAASNVNDTQYFDSDDDECNISFAFDKVKFTVDLRECKTADLAFNGVYERKK
jgi:hypothetical protein